MQLHGSLFTDRISVRPVPGDDGRWPISVNLDTVSLFLTREQSDTLCFALLDLVPADVMLAHLNDQADKEVAS